MDELTFFQAEVSEALAEASLLCGNLRALSNLQLPAFREQKVSLLMVKE